MQRMLIFISLSLFMVCGLLFSQTHFGGGTPRFQQDISIIPFRMEGHKIYVQVKTDRSSRPLSFILDTGAFTSVSGETMQLLGLTKGPALLTSGEISYAHFLQETVSLQVGDMVVDEFRLVSMDYKHFYQAASDFHGFLGSDFLKFFYVKIDYRRKELTLSRKPLPIPRSDNIYRIKLDTRNVAFLPRISCRVDNSWNWSGLIDTGSPFAVVFPLASLDNQRNNGAPLIASDGLFASWPTSTIERNYLSRVKNLSVSKLEFDDMPVLFANSDDILLGEELLSRFDIYLHYPDNELILVPRTSLLWKNNFYSIGIHLGKASGNKTVVEGIWQGSPASLARVPLHAEVLKINKQSTSRLSLREMNGVLHNDRINTIELLVKDGYREKTYLLKKAPLLPRD